MPLNLLNDIHVRTPAPRCFLKKNLLAELQSRPDVASHHLTPQETKMKLALIGAAAIAAAAFATPVLAQAVVENPGYCAQFYPNANCQNLGPGNPYTDGAYYRDWQNGNAAMPHQVVEPNAYRYHGGPKYND
jgi:hypothetical protein